MNSCEITALQKGKHERKAFDCGDEALNKFLKEVAAAAMRKGESRTVVSAHEKDICGFATWAPGEFVLKPNKLAIPVLKLHRMGVAVEMQRQGIGKQLVGAAVKAAQHVREVSACQLVVVEAKKSTGAPDFYAKMGFTRFRDRASLVTMIWRLPRA